MPRIKFSDPIMSTFQGYFGTVLFKDGVSVESVDSMVARRLGALTSVTILSDGDGVPDRQAGVAAEVLAARHLEIPPAAKGAEPNDGPAEPVEVPFEQTLVVKEEPFDLTIQPAQPGVKVWSPEELEAIADASGIQGLREIGNALGVKNTSINGLIAEILAAQNSAAR